MKKEILLGAMLFIKKDPCHCYNSEDYLLRILNEAHHVIYTSEMNYSIFYDTFGSIFFLPSLSLLSSSIHNGLSNLNLLQSI